MASRSRPTFPSTAAAAADGSRATGTLLNVTCYAPTGNLTASGKIPQVGMAASNTYPFGTRLLVETLGVLTVEDRIGHGTDLDVFRLSNNECTRFGRQHLRIEVLR